MCAHKLSSMIIESRNSKEVFKHFPPLPYTAKNKQDIDVPMFSPLQTWCVWTHICYLINAEEAEKKKIWGPVTSFDCSSSHASGYSQEWRYCKCLFQSPAGGCSIGKSQHFCKYSKEVLFIKCISIKKKKQFKGNVWVLNGFQIALVFSQSQIWEKCRIETCRCFGSIGFVYSHL